ncbi:hypothetical protein [Pseudomonas cichorii]|uniref:Uncharacterized protein n=1 Tax=Pseudomonas cichorii TaxID=36746 RepID=A0ABQ1DH49_PSECI|nr:hypothetical protein [Pseudomonas cichorii]MBX8536645.1 hypothetical protein [Pseudomonas cichorii]QVE19351.1 hypothetical protein KGD89_11725 [Pseudomonas cichorii]GFM90207.1 hypothetical protein PSCICP_01790 [Pseudomonas cichorii]SDP23258.1 hypothetical protein SAMN05216599_12346 [Pseudomonas cichorii]
MDSSWFNESVKPLLKGISLEYSSFADGEFGDLERIELEGFNKLGTVEFWSKGWVGVDIYNCALDDQVMNVLLSPEEEGAVSQVFERFVKILMQDS